MAAASDNGFAFCSICAAVVAFASIFGVSRESSPAAPLQIASASAMNCAFVGARAAVVVELPAVDEEAPVEATAALEEA
jgi:hypothetical protein